MSFTPSDYDRGFNDGMMTVVPGAMAAVDELKAKDAEILKLTKQLEEARAKAVEECIEIGIASCKFTAEQRKAMRSAAIIYWQHSICADTAIMEVVEKCRNLLAGVTAPSEVDAK